VEKGSWLSRSTGGQYGKRTTLTCSGGGPGKIPCILYGLLKLLETCIVCSKLLESFKSLAHKSNHFSGLLPIPSQPSFPLAHRFDWPTLQCRIMYLQFQLPPHRSLDPSAGCSSSAGCAICFSLHLLPIPCRLRKVAFTLDYIHAGKQIFPEASTTPFLLYAFQGVLMFLTTIAILL